MKIPAINANPMGIQDGTYQAVQPIIQIKELEIDRIRYDLWKSYLERTPQIKTKKHKQ